MEAIASGTNKKRYLKSKVDEIKSLKRKFEVELSEIECLNEHLKVSENKKEILTSENIQNAKILLKETDAFLQGNQEDSPSYEIQDPQLTINNLMGDELRKERAGELFQYGFEVKYLPLARYLQTASKYISTDNWCAAREEFRLARVFDRYLELRAAKATTLLQIPQQKYPSRAKTQHDAILEEITWMSNDFHCETEWKIKIAHQLAVEARDFVLKKFGVWSNTKAVSKVKPISIDSEAFYRIPSTSNPLISSSVPVEKIDLSIESLEIPIDRDELADLCDLGDKMDKSVLGDLITTAEYQLGTSASFPSVIWYEHEDALLLELSIRYKRNWLLISSALNTQIYGGKSIRGPRGCQERLEELEKKSVTPKPQLTSPNPPLIHPHLLEKHNVKLGLMRGSSTKIITPRSIVSKKISFNVHPSHEAAARKANQNISKLLTPSELAQKRLQRTRLVNETGTLNVPSIPRSTPSPNPSATGSGTTQHVPTVIPQVPGTSNSGSVPNLPPMPSAVPSGGPVYNNNVNASAAAAAAQQIAAGMMRSGMMRPPQAKGSQTVPPSNPMIAQLQQLQQQMQIQQQQQQQNSQFSSESPSKTSPNFRPSVSGQGRPPSANGPINFMNLPPGITPLQIQQLQQKQAQVQQAAQLQQMYAKTMQSRPPNPSTTNSAPKTTSVDETSSNDQLSSNNPNLRTSPRKSSKQ